MTAGLLLLTACTTFDRDGEDPAGSCEWLPYHFNACAVPLPVDSQDAFLPAGAYFIDTSSPTPTLVDVNDVEPLTEQQLTVEIIEQDEGPELVLLVFQRFTLEQGATLRGWSRDIPSRPLVLASWNQMSINGNIDVRSYQQGDNERPLGAGGDEVFCTVGDSNGTRSLLALGGGGGGGFGANGAGSGRVGAELGGEGGESTPVPQTVRGGCRGGLGVTGNGADGGMYGSGGGAVLLASRMEIVLADATIEAGGAGGEPTPFPLVGGGGGGGSGGFIGFDAPSVIIQSGVTVVSNGGAGAGGRSDAQPTRAQAGADGTLTLEPAAGGVGDSGANGGNGGFRAAPVGIAGVMPTDGSHGTGGGGAGVGFIVTTPGSYLSVDPAAVISPAVVEQLEEQAP